MTVDIRGMDTVEKYREYVNTSFLTGVEPVTVVSAHGATIVGADGTAYVDLFAGISVVNVGHVHPSVTQAAKQQIDDLIHCCSYLYHVPAVADLAERLAQITPGRLQKSFFGNSGAEAVEGALRLAKAATGSVVSFFFAGQRLEGYAGGQAKKGPPP